MSSKTILDEINKEMALNQQIQKLTLQAVAPALALSRFFLSASTFSMSSADTPFAPDGNCVSEELWVFERSVWFDWVSALFRLTASFAFRLFSLITTFFLSCCSFVRSFIRFDLRYSFICFKGIPSPSSCCLPFLFLLLSFGIVSGRGVPPLYNALTGPDWPVRGFLVYETRNPVLLVSGRVGARPRAKIRQIR